MKEEGVEDPVRWTLDQLKTRFPAMVKQAGYKEIAGNRPASDYRSAHPVRAGNNFQILISVGLQRIRGGDSL